MSKMREHVSLLRQLRDAAAIMGVAGEHLLGQHENDELWLKRDGLFLCTRYPRERFTQPNWRQTRPLAGLVLEFELEPKEQELRRLLAKLKEG